MKFVMATILALFASAAFAETPTPEDYPQVLLNNEAAPTGMDEAGNPIYRLSDLAEALIYGGTQSLGGEFPAMGYITNGSLLCTATAVANNAVISAAHCLAPGQFYFHHRQSQRGYPIVCSAHPQYNPQTLLNDFALCRLSERLPPDSILGNISTTAPSVGDKFLLNGYGQPNVKTHFWGSSNMVSLRGQDISTCGNPSNLGKGDSGGSLLEWTDDRTLRSHFEIVGINSRGNTQCDFYNATSSPLFISWARQYEQAQGVRLCGISVKCSSAIPEPGPGNCASHLAQAQANLTQALSAVDRLKSCIAY